MSQQCEWDITVEDLQALRDEGADFVLIDVREVHEYETSNIEGHHIPLGTLAEKLHELDKDAHIVIHCKSGGRSAHATNLLRDSGFSNVWNVQGGLLAWISRIDPTLSL